MRVLVLGSTGMLGHKLVEVLSAAPQLEVHTAARTLQADAPRHHELDLTEGSAPLGKLLDRVGPDVVVNALGAIKQRDLETDIDGTFFLNGTLPHIIAARAPSARLLHFSTDCVFKGDRGNYVDTDIPDAEDVYGRSKAMGEVDYGSHLTFRTSVIGFEWRSHLSLVSWMFRQQRGSTIKGYRHAIFSGLPTVTLAHEVRRQIESGSMLSGLWHIASEPISKYDLLVRLNDAFDLGLRIEPDDDFRVDRSLNDDRFRKATGTSTPAWGTLIADLVRDFKTGGYASAYQAIPL